MLWKHFATLQWSTLICMTHNMIKAECLVIFLENIDHDGLLKNNFPLGACQICIHVTNRAKSIHRDDETTFVVHGVDRYITHIYLISNEVHVNLMNVNQMDLLLPSWSATYRLLHIIPLLSHPKLSLPDNLTFIWWIWFRLSLNCHLEVRWRQIKVPYIPLLISIPTHHSTVVICWSW